ncbi:MAG: N-carbamoylputrescine amidase [Campylobacterota bacterium]|nr:N-carbamoylputrescine amidase [Campylobacterota bacterium]
MVKVAAVQMRMSQSQVRNLEIATSLVRQAAQNGAQIILLPELFENLYFCKDMDKKYFELATSKSKNPAILHFQTIAKELKVVLPISYFESSDEGYFNALVVIDADGNILQNYRKTHIPDGPGYEEKFYFKPGNSGFKVYKTQYASIGIGICWDQWFPETARSLALMGADLIFYPTAIGSEPEINVDSKEHWQRVQMGHSAANMVPVVVANRFGEEMGESCSITFYGSSFITDYTGEKVVEAQRDSETIIYADFDLKKIKKVRDYWGLFKDRRPAYYKELLKE